MQQNYIIKVANNQTAYIEKVLTKLNLTYRTILCKNNKIYFICCKTRDYQTIKSHNIHIYPDNNPFK
jgi:hypothetical protein